MAQDPSQNTMSWGEKFVTWQAFGIITTMLTIGIGWSLVATQQADARSQKRDEDISSQVKAYTSQQQVINDSVIRVIAQQENMLKTLDKIANKLNVQ